MSTQQNDFVQGLYVDKKDTQYGEIVKLSFKTENFIKFLQENTNEKGYCNIDILSTRDGKKYAKKNNYMPKQETKQPTTNETTTANTGQSDNLPF